MCELMPLKNNDKAWIWTCNDFSEEEAQLEKLGLRFQTVENAGKFKEAWGAAKKFNATVKEGKEDLVWAEVVEDKEEIVVDDQNKNAEEETKDEEQE